MQQKNPPILALETSCDECSASIVRQDESQVEILSNIVFSQIDIHKKFGGVVPEVASRNHLDMITTVVDDALKAASLGFKDLGAIAVTQRPGLIGALLVGVSVAKAFAYALKVPLITVNHLEGHLHSIFIKDQKKSRPLAQNDLPMVACLVSGGHTNLYLITRLPPLALNAQKLSESRDDAAGEAFDKCAKLLGLPYPGGIHLDRLARNGDKKRFDFPRPMPGKTLEFSFSGLKTAVSTEIKNQGFTPHVSGEPNPTKLPQGKLLDDFCASTQEAIVQTLMKKIMMAMEQTQAQSLAIVGGVSANSRFRELLDAKIKKPVFIPDAQYCTDNAAMIGTCAAFMYSRGEFLTGAELLKANAYSS